MRHLIAVVALAVAASAAAAVPTSEREALVALYQATGGANWKNKTNWLGAAGTECTWYGVECDGDANVIRLLLYDNNLTGRIPPDLRKLTRLEILHLWDNALSGPIPPELGELSSLEVLILDRNRLTGRIPAEFGALKKLTVLEADGNQLQGPLPPELGAMTALVDINLSFNAITGPLPPELGKLTNLVQLELSENQLSGPIPSSLGSLSKLEVLGLTVNQLSGPIPPQLGELPAIRELRLSYNNFTGGIPAQLGRAKTLEVLNLANNYALGGTIPAELGDLGALRLLDLQWTSLTGFIPQHLYDLKALETLQLGNNELGGNLSPDLGLLTSLMVLGLNNNQFTGPIPNQITTIKTLTSLELSGNELTGPIPPDIGKLTELSWLDLSGNALTGPIPRQLGTLSKLTNVYLYENRLDGGIPAELGDLTNLVQLYLDHNRLGGTIPESLRRLTRLERLGLRGNDLTGPVPSWIGELKNLTEVLLGNNQLTGSIPPGIGTLVNLDTLELNDNALSGPLPREIAGLTGLDYLDLSNNSLDGEIPREIAALTDAYNISLGGNRFSGTIPTEIGDLAAKLQYLSLAFNALRGPIPASITKLTKLVDHESHFNYNALFTDDEKVRAFVSLKNDGELEETQTVRPENVRIVSVTDRSATLSWTPIFYDSDAGGYQVAASKSRGGPPAAIATTRSKDFDSLTIRNLDPATTYFFTVTTVTHPHDVQKNLVASEPSLVVQATTGARVLAPPEVVISERPQGMVRIDDVEAAADRFTLTNFGDLPTLVELERGGQDGGEFFTVSPESFTIAGGASQIVQLRSRSRAAGSYQGYVIAHGQGVGEDVSVSVSLLAVARPAGTVVAEALSSVVELSGSPDSIQVGTVQFRNRGTAELAGILVSDQPWIEPPADTIRIGPGQTLSINFRVNRARRRGPSEGAQAANLSLIYVDGASASLLRHPITADTSGVNSSKVTVIDTTKPPVTSGSIPGVVAGQVPLFIPGMLAATNVRSDLTILNGASALSVNDLKLYWTQGGSTSIASPQSLAAASAISLVNLVGNVFGSTNAIGAVQLRTSNWQSISTEAKVTNVTPAGTYSGSVPVFRGDRSIIAGERIYLTGLAVPGDLFVQETAGGPASVRIEFLDAAGNNIGVPRDEVFSGFALVQLPNIVPANAATAIVTNVAGTFTAYARVRDAASGDTWSVVDWSRFYDFGNNEAVRIPFVDGFTSGGGKRRSVRSQATAPRAQTDLVLFNPGAEEARVKLQVIETSGIIREREQVIAPRATIIVSDVASTSQSPTAHLVIVPTRGTFIATARSRRDAGSGFAGTAIPVLAATSGLRLGQTQIFANLDDSTSATVNSATASTFRTSYGLVETSGGGATVKARIIIGGAYALVSVVTDRTFTLGPRQQVFLPELVRSFAGDLRDTAFGDLYGLSLEFEVTSGNGSVVPFVIATDNGTNDPVLRVQ